MSVVSEKWAARRLFKKPAVVEVSQMKMNESSKAFRKCVIEEIELLASHVNQMSYELDVPIADVPAELICGFVDDLYYPETELFRCAFTDQEQEYLAELHRMVCIASDVFTKENSRSVADIQNIPEWRSVMTFARDLLPKLKESD